MNKLIGRVLATEKSPTTMDKFTFWTNSDLKLHAFDIVKVQHIEGSFTFGVIENISHITDAQSFLTNFISSDFEPNRRPVGDSLPKLLTILKTASCQGGLFCLPSCY